MAEELKKNISRLTEQEAKSILLNMLITIEMQQDGGVPKDEFCERMIDFFDDFKKRGDQPPRKHDVQAIHIVFGLSVAGSLKMALKQAGKADQEDIIAFPGILSIGPLSRLETKEGRMKRYKWLKEHLNDYDDELKEQHIRFEEEIHRLDGIQEHVPVIIWAGDNAHEQTGLRFALKLLHRKTNDIFHINTSSKGAVVYRHSGEILPEKLGVLYEKRAFKSRLAQGGKHRFLTEWEELSRSKNVLRTWKNKKIKGVEENFFDALIIDRAAKLQERHSKKDFIVWPRVVGEVLGHLDEYIGDEFIEYRIRELIYKGGFEIKGVPKAMRYYSVRLASFI